MRAGRMRMFRDKWGFPEALEVRTRFLSSTRRLIIPRNWAARIRSVVREVSSSRVILCCHSWSSVYCFMQVFSALRGPRRWITSDNPRSMAWHCNGTTNQEMVIKLKGKWPPAIRRRINAWEEDFNYYWVINSAGFCCYFVRITIIRFVR